MQRIKVHFRWGTSCEEYEVSWDDEGRPVLEREGWVGDDQHPKSHYVKLYRMPMYEGYFEMHYPKDCPGFHLVPADRTL